MVAGVVTGPTVIGCIERGDFGQCIGEAYFGAQPVTAEAEPVAQEPVATAETDPEPESVEETPVAVPAVAPAFALVRVEPDGSAVIAGTASPTSEVRIFANDDLVGSETTEASGDFAHVTASPLPTGGIELRLLDVASGEYASTSIVVIVPEDRAGEPLVVASEPGQASEILQGLEAEPAEVAPEEASEAIEAPLEIAALPTESVEEPAAEADAPSDLAAVVIEDEPAEVVTQAPEAQEPVIEEVIEEPVTEPVAPEPAPAPALAEEPQAPEEAPVEALDEEIAVADAVDAVEEAAPAPAIVIVPPTIEAVEIDGDRNFFAGSGTDGLAVRLYVENQPVGTTEVRDGRWLVEAINVLTAASQRIRIDMLNADGSVAGRAEVDFVIDLPAPQDEPAEAPAVVAETPAPAPAVSEPAPAPVAEVAPSVSAAESAPVAEPAEIAEPEPIAEPGPIAEPEVAVAAEDAVQPVVDDTAEQAVPTMVGTTTGDRTTSGQVIIRRGDNLWTIARRVYGEGLRYTQIYEANANSIRNPDLIYPGQVFGLPGTDMVIGGE